MDAPVEIIQSIESAFAGVPRGELTLHQAEVIDSDSTEEAQLKARSLDQESTWDQVPDEDLEDCTAALCHLDPQSWKYYLPAYMIWALRNYQHSDSIMLDFTIYSLKLSDDDKVLSEYDMQRFRLLDEAQSATVCKFLNFMAQQPEFVDEIIAMEAISLYWHKFYAV